jgi:predicted membrane-bound spermidine synthase
MTKKIGILFFITGAASLVLEVAWTKLGTVLIGNTVSGAAIVLCCYLAGLAAGAWYFGRRADSRQDSLLWLMGILQIAIALASLAGGALAKVDSYFPFHFPFWTESVFFCIAMVVPAFFMGGTLPVACRFLSLNRDTVRLNRDIGSLYAVNTLGAAFGTIAAGFFLLENFGIFFSIMMAACAYTFVGVAALFLDRSAIAVARTAASPKTAADGIAQLSARMRTMLIILSGAAGAAFFSYELLYTRMLSLFWNSTIYSFTIASATFLAGGGCGSAAAAAAGRARKGREGFFHFLCGSTALTGICAMGSCVFWSPLAANADAMAWFFPHHVWLSGILTKAIISALAMVLPAFFYGALFVFLVKMYAMKSGAGKSVGGLSAANTAGAIAGILLAGFGFIPLFGAFTGFVVTTALLLAAAGICLLAGASFFSFFQKCGVSALILCGVALIVLVHAPYPPASTGQTIYLKEGATATVRVVDASDGTRRLFFNSREEGNTGVDPIRYARLEACLPLFLHRSPEKVLIIGMGTGITAGEACGFPDTRVVRCVELSPEIAHAAGFFSQENRKVLSDAKFRLTVTDGRRFLRATGERFDLVIMDLVHPCDNIGTLYSREFYRLARSHLNPGGLFCQWISLAQCTGGDLRSVFATFAAVFPNVSVWSVGSGRMLAVVGRETGISLDYGELAVRFTHDKESGADLETKACISPYALASWFVMGKRGIGTFCGPKTVVNTDDCPYFEYTATKMVRSITPSAFDRIGELLACRDSVSGIVKLASGWDRAILDRYGAARNHIINGGMLNEQRRERESLQEYQVALGINPRDEDAQYCLGISRYHEQKVMERLAASPEDPDAIQELAYIYCQNRRFDEAAAFLEKILARQQQPTALFVLGRVYEEKGDTARAIDCYEKLQAYDPGNSELRERIDFLRIKRPR